LSVAGEGKKKTRTCLLGTKKIKATLEAVGVK